MGQMHFHVPDAAAGFFHASRWEDAYLCGMEGVPWQTRNVFHPTEASGVAAVDAARDLPAGFRSSASAGGRLTLTRGVDTSAKLLITSPIDRIGFRVLSTCSLRCIDAPHNLVVELARGSCHRVRAQADIWQRGGLSLSDRFDELLATGTERFLDALQPRQKHGVDAHGTGRALADCEAEIQSTRAGIEAISLLEQAAAELSKLFAAQSMAFRRTREPRLSTMMAAGVLPSDVTISRHRTSTRASPGRRDPSAAASSAAANVAANASPGLDDGPETIFSEISQAFNAVAVRISWGEIENASGTPDFASANRILDQCASTGMRVIGGPVIDHRAGMLPDWLALMDNHFDQLMSAMTKFVEATVNEFRGRVHLWNAASGLNVCGPLGLDDEQVMRFSIGVLQTIRRCDPQTPVVMSIDQPCGEYLARHADGISPIHFADALLRSGLGLAGIGLNFRFGYEQGDTQPRTALEFAQLIDRWGTLSAPLLVQLSIPAAPGLDPGARIKTAPVSLAPEMNGQAAAWARQQYDFARPLIETLLAKQIVHAVVWDGASDQLPHVMPHTGVIDSMGAPRPLHAYLAGLRDELLM
ncbi:endo-1,4-beta-xylanase [Allorhodopirellula heiligendammensis]|uniref:GH10 domain-containing protein n=1 Tax=Allorhodopirellula heiligendammensis TaxID=2714739 RepID=A0A5C6C4Z6_9BACT|nr:endo-1,4-beta-xylanase [Allorhodopirellula heiligendammensis]TWU19633.1 hypothetical protein Poly21_18080 [Allorhodopirellula heiligendammensis]